jgi:hypothetical protein
LLHAYKLECVLLGTSHALAKDVSNTPITQTHARNSFCVVVFFILLYR